MSNRPNNRARKKDGPIGSLNAIAALPITPEHARLQLNNIKHTILTLQERERILNELLTEAEIHETNVGTGTTILSNLAELL